MKIRNFVLIIALIGISLPVFTNEAPLLEDRTIIARSYYASSQTQVEISNKYGTVHLNTWDKDSVKFVINMIVKARDNGWLERLRGNIDFEFISTQHYIVAKSIFRPSAKTFYKEMKDALESEQAVIIDWEVYLPKNPNIRIENRYGDLYTADLNGKIDITIEHGNLKAHNLSGDVELETFFGDVSINKIDNGRLSINYSQFQLENATELRIDSKSSEIEIKKADRLTVEARRDEYLIIEVNELDINAVFSTTVIEDVRQKLFANLRYGTFEVDNSLSEYKMYTISSASTDVKLAFEYENANYSIDITHRKARLILPKEIKEMNEVLQNEREEIYHLTGRMGKLQNPNAKLNLNLEGCELFIYHK